MPCHPTYDPTSPKAEIDGDRLSEREIVLTMATLVSLGAGAPLRHRPRSPMPSFGSWLAKSHFVGAWSFHSLGPPMWRSISKFAISISTPSDGHPVLDPNRIVSRDSVFSRPITSRGSPKWRSSRTLIRQQAGDHRLAAECAAGNRECSNRRG